MYGVNQIDSNTEATSQNLKMEKNYSKYLVMLNIVLLLAVGISVFFSQMLALIYFVLFIISVLFSYKKIISTQQYDFPENKNRQNTEDLTKGLASLRHQ